MRFYKTRRLRIISGASLLLLLTGAPVLLGVMRPSEPHATDAPAALVAYARGLSSMGLAGFVALGFAALFGLLLLDQKRQKVGRIYLAPNARRYRNLVEMSRTLAVILGAAGLIVGSLAGFYAALLHARPDLATRLFLPFLTSELALGGLFVGGALYALGRLGR
jgi:hypothetical protein